MATLNIRQLRFGLWTLAGISAGAAVLTLTLAAALPLDGPARSSVGLSSHAANPNGSINGKNPDANMWNLDLRKPLIDTPQIPVAEPSRFIPPSMPTFRIIGTVVEADHSTILIDVGGKTQFKSVGDVVNGLRIDAINDDGCVVNFDGRPVALRTERPAPITDAPPPGARPANPYGGPQ